MSEQAGEIERANYSEAEMSFEEIGAAMGITRGGGMVPLPKCDAEAAKEGSGSGADEGACG